MWTIVLLLLVAFAFYWVGFLRAVYLSGKEIEKAPPSVQEFFQQAAAARR
jgi:hypothetical protein